MREISNARELERFSFPCRPGVRYGCGDIPLLILGTYLILAGAWIILAFLHRRRPVLEVVDGEIRFGSIFGFRRRSVPIDEVQEVDDRRGRLLLGSGREMRFPLGEIRRSERSRAIDCLRARLERHSSESVAS